MPELRSEVLKALAAWRPNGHPVSTLYLDVDGRRYPRHQEFVLRAQELCHRFRHEAAAAGLGREATRLVECDAGRMRTFVEEEFERGRTRGIALFCSSGAGLWEVVEATRPVRDRAVVSTEPHIGPLEALLETFRSSCTALVDRSRARIFLTELDRTRERTDVFDEVPGRHEQGGRAQARYRRHVEDHVARHLHRVAEVLLRLFQDGEFDRLIVGGPDEAVADFERILHPYVAGRIAAKVTLPLSASVAQVGDAAREIEERLEAEREAAVVERLRAGAAAGRQALLGLDATLRALGDGRVDTLVVPAGVEAPGSRCDTCGRLWVSRSSCASCGSPLTAVLDVVDTAVVTALRHGCRVETISMLDPDAVPDVGALLRY